MVPKKKDVRERSEYAKFKAKTFPWQSVNLPFSEFSVWKRSGQINKYKKFKIALICNKGQVSAQATVRLTRVYGFDQDKVQSVQGGITNWVLKGYGIEQP